MKIFLPVLLIALSGITSVTQAQQAASVKAVLPLRKVTLALNQAELLHQGAIALPAGRSLVRLEQVARGLNSESMQVEVSDNAELVSVTDETIRPASGTAPADSIALLEARLRRLDAEQKGLEEEKAFLLANRTMPTGLQAGWSTELQKGATLLRTRLPDIQTQTEVLTARRQDLTRRRDQIAYGGNGQRREQVLITVVLARAATVQITLRYTENNSSWEPKPEIRVPESGRELRLRTQAEIENNSGLPWTDVQLALKNEEVDEDVTRPDLSPWTMNFRRSIGGEGRIDKFVVKGKAAGQNTTAIEPVSAYVVPQAVSIADKESYQVLLPEQVLPARPEYLAVPKLSDKVFLQAKVTGWDKLNLPADELEANVYYRGTYVGTTEIDPRAYNDSLEIGLGYDDQILVGRTKTQDFNGKAGLGSQQITRLTYEINLRNRHAQAVRVRVLDQIPVSQESDLRVKLEDAAGAHIDEASGKLTWLVNLAPGASQRLQFTFTVEYPKGKSVDFQRPRRVASPKFR